MTRGIAILIVLATSGCSEDADLPAADANRDQRGDADVSGTTRVYVQFFDGRPPDTTVFIDGVETEDLEIPFESFTEHVMHPIEVELVHDGAVVGRMNAPHCDSTCPEIDVTEQQIALCGMPTGQLRFGSNTCSGNGRVCVGDGFCEAPCSPWFGCGDRRCGILVTHPDPGFRGVACVPDGDVAVGGACAFGAPGLDTGYDDCVDGAGCIDGACRTLCWNGDQCEPGESCLAHAELPADVRVCVAGA